MKKTTYILIIGLALSMVFCFFIPAIFFKKVRYSEVEHTVKLNPNPQERLVEQSLPRFESVDLNLDPHDLYCDIHNESGDWMTPVIIIEESDSVSLPMLKLNESWAEILRINVIDSALEIKIDSRALKKRFAQNNKYSNSDDTESQGADVSDYATIVIPEHEELLGTLIVPRHMLTYLGGNGIDANLSGFKDAELVISYSSFTAQECSFKSLTVMQ